MSEAKQLRQVSYPTLPTQPFRLDVPLHALLKVGATRPAPGPLPQAQALPDPVFPQHPGLQHEIDAADIAAHEQVVRNKRRHWGAAKILHTMNGWMFPYFKSRLRRGDFQPIIA